MGFLFFICLSWWLEKQGRGQILERLDGGVWGAYHKGGACMVRRGTTIGVRGGGRARGGCAHISTTFYIN